jgi:dephospho-CoA kinase
MLPVKKAIIFCGMPGSGKSVGATVAKDLGIPIYVMGDIVREEATSQQLQYTPQTLGKVMIELRQQLGPAIIAQRVIEKLSNESESNVVIDGARSEIEVKTFQEAIEQVLVVAVHAAPHIRFERLRRRGREDDSFTQDVFQDRDNHELEVGLGRIIAQADIMIVNEGKFEKLKAEVRRVLTNEFDLDSSSEA